MDLSVSTSAICMFDDSTENVAFCEGCNDFVCAACWTKIRAHRENLPGPGGIPHQRVDPRIKEKMTESMAEPVDQDDERRQHEGDEDTKWFALDKDDGGEPILAEYRRYASIMMDSSEGTAGSRYPRLVSFIGETGAGKSSIIRLLIGPTRQESNAETPRIAAPIIGRAACDIPTSADVHLYLDPHSQLGSRPILLADCEGFKGGESSVAAKTAANLSDQRPTAANPAKYRSTLQELGARGKRRILKWAQRSAVDSEETGKRTFAVKQMYPQVFYAFSDVVVFVLTQPKTLEVVVEELLKWADKNYKGSANLPSKPHVIIAINKCESATPADQWNTATATADLLSATNSQIRKNKTFEKYVKIWEKRDLDVEDMRDLLKCYYSSVHVVRIPQKSRYNLLSEQRDKLYNLILECCDRSSETKLGKRMLADVDEFGLYLSLAFDHFAESLEVPFDFIRASLKSNPPPETFPANLYSFILQVARWKNLRGKIEALFDLVKSMVASCIMLDSSRNQRMGHPKAWFVAAYDGKSYRSLCSDLVLEYFENFVPCSFSIRDPFVPKHYLPCQIRRKTHDNMHRHYRAGQSFEHRGRFENSFDPKEYKWADQVLGGIEDVQERFSGYHWNGLRHGWAEAHKRCIKQFYTKLGEPRLFDSHAICLCCLANPPEHHLQCGHVICSPCAIDFGRNDTITEIVVEECPVCDDDTRGNASLQTIIPRPPPFSGQRILVLDGGGVRGIVELRVLEALENELHVPLQRFFDLVVGTSTGGIVALAFGDLQMPVKKCIRTFEDLVNEAFTLRKGQTLHIIKHLQKYLKRSKYETRPLNRALQAVFGPSRLMFGRRDSTSATPLNVAVTAASGTAGRGYILSNYNTRTSPNIPRCQRYRPERAEDELETWEAARSTSAAIGFFKPYKRDHLKILPPEFTDGGLFQNNPIQVALEESRSLAKSRNQVLTPDLVLSVGTGLPKAYLNDKSYVRTATFEAQTADNPWFRVLFSVVDFQIKLNLDAEKRWRDQVAAEFGIKDRMHRINPWLGEDPPEMDDKECVSRISKVTAHDLVHDEDLHNKVLTTAGALAASSFYFAASKVLSERVGVLQVAGFIKCRLSGSESDIQGLGQFLSNCKSSFLIQSTPGHGEDIHVAVPRRSMAESGVFEDIALTIEVPGEEAETTIYLKLPGMLPNGQLHPISGFPRGLFRQDAASVSRKDPFRGEDSIADSAIEVPVRNKELE